jgi:pyruvate/2-oxoglutarate dehydrogenase complex dihydrolipoamide acyltransferase (E2) component
MKYLSLKQPVAVLGRLVYPDAGVLMLDDAVEAQRLVDTGQAEDVTAEFEAAIAASAEAEAAEAAAAEAAATAAAAAQTAAIEPAPETPAA